MPHSALPHSTIPKAEPARRSAQPPIRILVVDDSLIARRVIARILDEDGRFAVIGAPASAAEALSVLATAKVDMILLDVEMPDRGGLECLPDLLAVSHDARIVILTGHHAQGGAVAMRALAEGARDVIAKPAAGHFSPAFGAALADRLVAVLTGEDKVSWTGESSRKVSALPGLPQAPYAIGIGASTGGIHALGAFFQALDSTPPAPIFITQHLPADFVPFFAEQLSRQTSLGVHVAEDGMIARAGQVYIAPGHAHLTVRRTRHRSVEIAYSLAQSRHGAFPAVDPMFASLAEVFGARSCGLIFSGMGRDGLAGAESIVCAGGSVIAQDSESSVVWGMPGAVVQAGLACLVLPPDQAARSLLDSWRVAA